MKGQAIVLTGASGDTGTLDALTRSVIEQAHASEALVRVAATEKEAAALLVKESAPQSPTVLIVCPDVSSPVSVARRMYHRLSALYVVFAVKPDRAQELRRNLAYAAPPGANWSVERADSTQLGAVVGKALQALFQQRRLRTTLDRVNLRLATPPADASDYRRLIVSDRYLASILTHVQDAIISLDRHGTIISWNAGAARLFAIDEREAIGRSIFALLPDVLSLPATLQRVLQGELARQELPLAAADGDRFFDATFSAIHDEEHHPIGIAAMIRDVTRSKRAEAALRESEERLRSILDRAPAVVFMKNREGRYLFVNAEFLRIFERAPDDVLGKMDFELFPQIAHELQEHDERVWQTEMPLAIEETVPHVGGMRTYLAQKFLLRDSTGTPYALCGIASDISERLRVEQVLRDSDRRKDEFLAILAHELRNPLAPIRHAIKIASMPAVSAEQVRWSHEVIERQVHHMARLLDDLLDVSRITRGKLELRKERVYLASVIGAAIETARPLIEAKGHHLTVDLPVEAVSLEADPIRLAQVFSNLLTNAAKYTDRGGSLRVQALVAADEVIVSVSDNGIGIAADALPNLFEMFSQVTSALERSEGGLGIGLALVRGLVDLHGGTIEARSDGVGKGSAFVIRLPLTCAERAPTNQTTMQAADAVPAGSASLRIVIADDNSDSLDSLAMLLRLQGYDVHTAQTGREALATVNRVRPHVAILDIGMPEMSGYQVAQEIRSHSWGRHVLLIASSGWGQEQDKRRAEGAGFDHHLTKPFNIERLQELLAQTLPS